MFKECPVCGAHLDPGEKCDCQDKKEDASAGTEASSKRDGSVTPILSSPRPDVNDCMKLRQICQSTGAQGKEIALIVREQFPKFNRQLLAQCQSPGKYGIVIHPDGLRTICDTYGIVPAAEPVSEGVEPRAEVHKAAPRKATNRRLGRKLTFRMTPKDYAKLVMRVDQDGFESVQAWLYEKVMKLLDEEKEQSE